MIQWPPIEFEHVELEAEWFGYVAFYLGVVDCCRPQSLTLIIDFSLLKFEEWESVVMVSSTCTLFSEIFTFLILCLLRTLQ